MWYYETKYIKKSTKSCRSACSNLGVGNGECVHPHAPASPLILDGMVKQYTEYVVDHFGDLLLLWVLWVNVAQREHPVLPHWTLQQTPTHITVTPWCQFRENGLIIPSSRMFADVKALVLNFTPPVFNSDSMLVFKRYWNVHTHFLYALMLIWS